MVDEPHQETRPLVAAVIPTHNRKDLLLRCLGCVSGFPDAACRPVVVFDGCTDGSQAAVSERFPAVLTVEGNGALWWSGAINAGIERALELGAGYILLLNDDVQPEPDMLA